MSIQELHEQVEQSEKRRKSRIRTTGKFKPKTIVTKFFDGELCDKDGDNITVSTIGDMTTWEIQSLLLDCLDRYSL